jgi:hypothetical protein
MRWTESQWLNNSYDDPQKYNSDLVCQVCFKKNHTSVECWHHFDESYVPEQKSDALAATNASRRGSDPHGEWRRYGH